MGIGFTSYLIVFSKEGVNDFATRLKTIHKTLLRLLRRQESGYIRLMIITYSRDELYIFKFAGNVT